MPGWFRTFLLYLVDADGCDFGLEVEGIGVMTGGTAGKCRDNPQQSDCEITHVVSDKKGNYIAGFLQGYFKMAKFDESGASISDSARYYPVEGVVPATPEEMLAYYEGGTDYWNQYIFVKSDGFSCKDSSPTWSAFNDTFCLNNWLPDWQASPSPRSAGACQGSCEASSTCVGFVAGSYGGESDACILCTKEGTASAGGQAITYYPKPKA